MATALQARYRIDGMDCASCATKIDIAVRDEPRADAVAGLKALSDAGIKTVMLTGDNSRTAKGIGKALGIEVRADLLPQDKQRIVEELKVDDVDLQRKLDKPSPAFTRAERSARCWVELEELG
jgi:magnesium-transporting ATPase (P-type)